MICSVIDCPGSPAKSPEPVPEQNIQPLFPTVPSLFGHVSPAFIDILYNFFPYLRFRYSLNVCILLLYNIFICQYTFCIRQYHPFKIRRLTYPHICSIISVQTFVRFKEGCRYSFNRCIGWKQKQKYRSDVMSMSMDFLLWLQDEKKFSHRALQKRAPQANQYLTEPIVSPLIKYF